MGVLAQVDNVLSTPVKTDALRRAVFAQEPLGDRVSWETLIRWGRFIHTAFPKIKSV